MQIGSVEMHLAIIVYKISKIKIYQLSKKGPLLGAIVKQSTMMVRPVPNLPPLPAPSTIKGQLWGMAFIQKLHINQTNHQLAMSMSLDHAT